MGMDARMKGRRGDGTVELTPFLPSSLISFSFIQDITIDRETLLTEIKGLKSDDSALVARNEFLEEELERVWKREGGEERKKGGSMGGAASMPKPTSTSFVVDSTLASTFPFSSSAFGSSSSSSHTSSSVSYSGLSVKTSPNLVSPPALHSNSLDYFPNETLSQILGYLHQPFHFYHYSLALLGPSNQSRPWNPVELQLVSRRWKNVAQPLFYFQVAFDAGNEDPLDILRACLFTDNTFRPKIKKIVIFGTARREEDSFDNRAFEQSLRDFGLTLGNFTETHSSIKSDPLSHLPLLDIVDAGNDRHWFALELPSPSLTLVPGPEASLYYGYVRNSSEPEREDADSLWVLRTRLLNLTIRLNKECQRQLSLLVKSFKAFVCIRVLRLDLNFSLTSDVVKDLEAILRTPTFRLAKRFFDDVPMKLHFGLRDEEEAARMREIVERVGEVHAEVFVDVFEV
ncbi:hypothetical protein BDY24DRAFT_392861 [Mrakia frigida]|uniref:uncharacterized protein n=1 Tax=Mrakia frigida TaxID=29902 RepID=UPI003FCC1854